MKSPEGADSHPQPVPPSAPQPELRKPLEIAIIGVSGRYPQSPNLETLWENVKAGRNCITTTPASRRALVGPETADSATPYWGGYLEDIDAFDAAFFNIEPIDAVNMDPQERLFLETAWAAMEDAGYKPADLSDEQGNRDIGVFAGAAWGQYQILGAEKIAKGSPVASNSFHWAISNRVSYCLNLHGPSMCVDTACSASMTAIHLACDSIRAGACHAAIAGGVNLDLHPSKQVILEGQNSLSADGKCHSFGDDATGYVASEGVGVVFLKQLDRAQADGDFIYAVIKHSVMNHDGRSSNFTVPNPDGQERLIKRALDEARVHARSIGFVEAHGTGTAMGDAIEIQSLGKIYSQYGAEVGTVPIGTVKTNIGHTESASGVAGLSKLLMQFRHRWLPISLNAESLSPYIDFETSPFVVQRQGQAWKPQVVDGREQPLRAALSTFGAGGANQHMILEEHKQPRSPSLPSPHGEIIVLSAADTDRLSAYVARLIHYLENPWSKQTTLRDIAHTLQVGRILMDSRLAVVADSMDALHHKLTSFLNGSEHSEGVFQASVEDSSSAKIDCVALFTAGNLNELASAWVRGVKIPWGSLYDNGWRIPLPSYPFARERFWLAAPELDTPEKTQPAKVVSPRTVSRLSVVEPIAEPAHIHGTGRKPKFHTRESVIEQLRHIVASLVKQPPQEIDLDRNFKEYDFDSLAGMKIINRIYDVYGRKISIMSFFEYSSIEELYSYLVTEGVVKVEPSEKGEPKQGNYSIKLLEAYQNGSISSEQAITLEQIIAKPCHAV